jgi:hypothetical protein
LVFPVSFALLSSVFLSPLMIWISISHVIHSSVVFFVGFATLDAVFLQFLDVDVKSAALMYTAWLTIQGTFGHRVATAPRAVSDFWLGLWLRTPLPALVTYAVMGYFFDAKKEILRVSEFNFRYSMMFFGNAVIALNLDRGIRQVRHPERLIWLITICFALITIWIEVVVIPSTFHWTIHKYFFEHGFRLLSSLALGVVASDALAFKNKRRN